jgi:hypothetical protein
MSSPLRIPESKMTGMRPSTAAVMSTSASALGARDYQVGGPALIEDQVGDQSDQP